MARILLFLIAWLHAAHATPGVSPPLSPGEQCRAAIVAAEKTHGIPPQLMAAIGRVESGRNGSAWPWTINAEGVGSYYNTKAEAIAAVEAKRAQGIRSIDVGCMQVNLIHHANAFANLDQAFEPTINADYAARFLLRLREQTGDWPQATGRYHSANPERGGPYASKVMAIWPEEQRKAGLAPPPPPAPVPQPPAPASPGSLFTGTFHTSPPPRQPLVTGLPGGRGLDAYRAAPIQTTMRIPFRLMR